MRGVRFIVGWLSLAITSLLSYALLRALAAIVYLGAPAFDWQWYIPVITLVLVASASLTYRWLHLQAKRLGRRTSLTLAFLFVWALLGFNGFGQNIYLQPDAAPAVPISFWAFSDFQQTPDAVLRDLRTAGGYIYLSVGDVAEQENAQALASAVRRLADYGLEIYLAPSLSNFLSAPVYAEWITRTYQVATFVQRERLLNVRGLIGDAEPPMNMPLDWLSGEQLAFDQSVAELFTALNDLHKQFPELQIGVTALWSQFVDVLDNDDDLARVARSPVNPPGNWAFVNLMTYSSYYPSDWRGYYVYLYEMGMARLYPASQRSHLIGLVGAGFPGEPLLDFEDLVRDARLSRAMGVREIVIFQLTDALRVFGDDFVERVAHAINASNPEPTMTVAFSRPVSLIFYGTVLLDALLDVCGSQVWLWSGWLIASGAMAWHWHNKR